MSESVDATREPAAPAEPTFDRRSRLVGIAQRRWVAALTDLGGRNTLLYYKDRRAGTLDLAGADPKALERLLRSGSVRVTRLFADVDARADAIRRVQTIHRKARELLEERGIRAGYLAAGLARWDELFLEPAAPVLLRGLTITPTRARHDDFELSLDGDWELNPVLLHKLATVYGAATDKITEKLAGKLDAKLDGIPATLREELTRIAEAAEVPGFEIRDRRVIGTFTYAKLPMVRDLQAAGDLLNDSDIVAAIAGDPDAQALLAAESGAEGALSDAPEEDFSVLDADSSQRSAIDAVLSGRSLLIHGPPGTGKSQTIANLIAALVARGRKVLFVAEKRAAVDAVLSRLKGVDLGDMILDIHDGTRDRVRIARDLGATLELARQAGDADVRDLHRRLADRQRRLTEHVAALHRPHEPWGLTPFAMQAALLGVPPAARTTVRLAAPHQIGRDDADRIRDDLREFTHLGGFTLRPATTPWYGAALHRPEDARMAGDLAARLSAYTLPRFADRTAAACAEAGLRQPATYAERAARIRLFHAIARTLRILGPDAYVQPALLARATGDAPGLGRRERRGLRREAESLWRGREDAAGSPEVTGRGGDRPGRQGQGGPSREELHQALRDAAAQRAAWDTLAAAGSLPLLPSRFADLVESYEECEAQLAALTVAVPRLEDPEVGLEARVAALAADLETAWKLPRLYELGARFHDLGLVPLLDELARRETTPELAAAAFDHAWYSSILDHVRVRDPRYLADRGRSLDEIADEFQARDIEHLAANRRRVRGAWAESLRSAQDRHPLQARVIRKQAALRRGHLPLRRLLDQTSDVLFSLKPCWAMSPLMVSQVLPPARLFDVVIFDEASQIVPADAIPSIVRAHQIVVAGDDRQLPPTNFFRQVDDGDEETDLEDEGAPPDDADAGVRWGETDAGIRAAGMAEVSFGVGFESVLDALRPLLPTCPLSWHYRSRDERLVAFSNTRIYGGALTTFPGVFRDDCLRHVVVAQDPTPGQEVSVTAEVDKVVELILEHAATLPHESLGVIALGRKHAERIDAALREVLRQRPDVEGFFAEDRPEPFFVKNLERVQGDERDAIILSIGYGKHPDGRMRYQWGPLLRDGGERRLNVAATRAKHRLTLVSSFSSHDVDPDRVTKAGARLLADYLEYAGSGGTPTGSSGDRELDAFEADVRRQLASHGISVVPQYGVGGYRVDFAVTHPDDPDRMVLAIESDGAAYRDSRSVRDRDRLRQEHLERLGWHFHRLWSTNWFHDPRSEIARLREAYDAAITVDGPPRPEPGIEPVPDAPSGARSQPQPGPRSAPQPPQQPQSEPQDGPHAAARSGSPPGPSGASAAEPRPDTPEVRRSPGAALAEAQPARSADPRQPAPVRRPIPIAPASGPGHELEPRRPRGLTCPEQPLE
ncbi:MULTISPECIES: AAA domain-containing protein [unclassified Pseudofrankia]|uniref:AAA domain-containing protein n=1 Tax=unclassified Pseudofrankia TaxID=2994372 RepID=UPI0008DAB4A9|nr:MULTISPECIES: AAA domain-containing protein [unclassified Pseudofrankia]MDT3445195.1 AAA domain-containing protein [Pseudofrankia sp. BMG5.37]OHV63325.1 hypothetical protein BCD48_04990 [Pseudofrankia sp. BMG5.36]